MEKCITSANHVLDKAIDKKYNSAQIPPIMFNKCKGVVLLGLVEAGVGVSVTHGSGVILAQNEKGDWSAPSALSLTGAGLGALVGVGKKDIVIIIVDEKTMSIYADGHITYGAESACVAGPMGKDREINEYLETGLGNRSFCYTFSEGAFIGFALEGATIKAKKDTNKKFYGSDASPLQVGAVTIPAGSSVSDLHEKLDKLKIE